MGQRSQIYVRFDTKENTKGLVARYFSWNFGERMVSRARTTIEFLLDLFNIPNMTLDDKQRLEKLTHIINCNFDLRDYQFSSNILNELNEMSDDFTQSEILFLSQDNNDGRLLLDINEKGCKYAFLKSDIEDRIEVMSAKEYMDWNSRNTWETSDGLSLNDLAICKRNIKFIEDNAKLMTEDEVIEYIFYDYAKGIFT